MGIYVVYNGALYSENELYHHGVKGMKWGVRKDRGKYRSGRPVMVDYSPEVAKKFARKGPKSGPVDSAVGRISNSNVKMYDVQRRITKAAISDMQATVKASKEYKSAALHDYPATVRYSKNLPALVMNKEKSSRWATTLSNYMDSINDDIGKVTISKDFFTKHQNDTVDDIINDGPNAMVAYMALNTAARSSDGSEQHRRMFGP